MDTADLKRTDLADYVMKDRVRRLTRMRHLEVLDIVLEQPPRTANSKVVSLFGSLDSFLYHSLMEYNGFEGNTMKKVHLLWTFYPNADESRPLMSPQQYMDRNSKSLFWNLGKLSSAKYGGKQEENPLIQAIGDVEMRSGIAQMAYDQFRRKK